ncbi:hypothetical protein VTJ83DRAFT_6930 [Remersonia thermophila]|uniref:Major facilitator superfamily (MFS) profile domain-containing protein n=1 Tax=Remersonia thermophila TaxID=72144 RepID=A0ABR4D6X2_9PEZI
MLGRKSIRINGADCGAEAIILGAVTSIGGFLFGYDTGQISGMLLFRDFKNRFGQVDTADGRDFEPIIQSLIVSLMSIGTLLGALTASYTADWFGRRKSLSFGVVIFIIGNIIQITAERSWVHLMMGRFVAGLGIGNLSVGVPMFQSESAPRQIRGAVVASYQLLITIGILVANIVNYGVRAIEDEAASWRIVIGLSIAFSLPLGLGILLVPESPRWLAARQRWDDARMSMARLRGLKDDPRHPLIEEDLAEMRGILEKEKAVGVGSWLECFVKRRRRRSDGGGNGVPKQVYRTYLGVAIHFLQQWTGVNYFFYYGATVFQSAGVDDPIRTQLILGAVNVAMTFFGLYVVERYGRRTPLIVGAAWQAAWLAVFAAVGTALLGSDEDQAVGQGSRNRTAGIVMIVSACMFIASFAMTWGPICWVVVGETFPLRTRAKQASLATAGNWLGNFLISFLTPLATSGINYAYGFVFVATNIAGLLLVYFFLYESVSLSLENVDAMYGDPSVKPWTSKRWVPPGYATRMLKEHGAGAVDGGERAASSGRSAGLGGDRVRAGDAGRPGGLRGPMMPGKESAESGAWLGGTESREEKVERPAWRT